MSLESSVFIKVELQSVIERMIGQIMSHVQLNEDRLKAIAKEQLDKLGDNWIYNQFEREFEKALRDQLEKEIQSAARSLAYKASAKMLDKTTFKDFIDNEG